MKSDKNNNKMMVLMKVSKNVIHHPSTNPKNLPDYTVISLVM